MLSRKSAGVVVFKGQPREYLLLHYDAGHWDFPKGGIEAGEKEEEALRRELKEETGITSVELVPGFREEFSYFYKEKGVLVHKTVVFRLGATTEEKVVLSFEHQNFAWLPFDEAFGRLTFKNAKDLLAKAEEFLNRRKGLPQNKLPNLTCNSSPNLPHDV